MSTAYWVPLGAAPVTQPTVTYGTTPPASPNDGDLWIFPADATNGVMWQFRYRAASASAYKWEFVGGSSVYAAVETAEATTSTTPANLATVGPSITAPRAGEYLLTVAVAIGAASAGAYAMGMLKVGAAAAIQAVGNPNVGYLDVCSVMKVTAAAADVLLLQYQTSLGTANFARRRLALVPARVS
jgi:hypothetical protein